MKVNVKVNIDCKKILQSRGLGQSGAAARHLANLVAKHSDKRVPFQAGHLKNQHTITVQNGAAILEYTSPTPTTSTTAKSWQATHRSTTLARR